MPRMPHTLHGLDPNKPTVGVAYPGCGTLLGAVAAVHKELHGYFNILPGGTSGGGEVGLAHGSGLSPDEIIDFSDEVLTHKGLKDIGYPWQGGTGLYRGNKIENILKGIYKDKTYADMKFRTRITAASLWTRRVGIMDSVRHSELKLWRVGRACLAIEGFFDAVRIRDDNARLYGDGGIGLNVPAGIWDDYPQMPTIVVRFSRQQQSHSVEELMQNMDGGDDYKDAEAVRNHVDMPAASFELLMNAASASFPSRKHPSLVHEVIISSDSDGMKFGISEEENRKRKDDGKVSAKIAIARMKRTHPDLFKVRQWQ